jgi:catechol 2,3-dioxygenase-like lactoylglutathione lyase family enzyme
VSRVQLALNVSDLDAAIDFYSTLFDAEPNKGMPGYANFSIADPPLKLVLIEDGVASGNGVTGILNHLGVEVTSTDAVVATRARWSSKGLNVTDVAQTTCCYAVQDKIWVHDPDGAPWEVYTVLADASAETGLRGDDACCVAAIDGEPGTQGAARSETCCR